MSENATPALHLIVLAGGAGTRARRGDAAAPKQFQIVGGRMLLLWSLDELSRAPGVVSLTVAAPASWHPVLDEAFADAGLPHAPMLAEAGATRTASTWRAASLLAERLAPAPDALVAVHDAARPFATRHLLARLAEAAARHGGAVPGVPVADTVVALSGLRGDEAGVEYLARDALRAVQTPQVFLWQPFFAAHREADAAGEAHTDDGGLLAARGRPPVLVMGEAENWKVTTDADLARAEALGRRGDQSRPER